MPVELHECALFAGLDEDRITRIVGLSQRKVVDAGEYLMLLGDHADQLFVVLSGRIEVCLPLSFQGLIQDVAVEEIPPGESFGWSALVKPYRFTLSARASEDSEVLVLPRQALMKAFVEDPALQASIAMRVAETVGKRLLAFQALWVRELQRAIESGRIGASQVGGAE